MHTHTLPAFSLNPQHGFFVSFALSTYHHIRSWAVAGHAQKEAEGFAPLPPTLAGRDGRREAHQVRTQTRALHVPADTESRRRKGGEGG